jgi:hypothetical protein
VQLAKLESFSRARKLSNPIIPCTSKSSNMTVISGFVS